MSSQTSINISSGEANRSGTDIQGHPQDRNQPEMDTIENLRMKLQALEKKYLDLTSQHSQDMSHYERDLMKLRLELERGEALCRVLESEMSLARKDTQVQMHSAEEELWDTKTKLLELQVRRGPRRHRYFPFPGSDVSSGGTLYVTCPTPGTNITSGGTHYVTCPTPGTDTAPESLRLPFVPQGISTPGGPAAHVHWGQPRHRSYSASGTDTTSESVPSYFIPRGVSTPVAPAPDVPASWRELSDDVFPTSWRELSDEVFTPARPISDEVFTPGRPISDEVFTPGTQLSDEVFTPGRPISDEVFTPGGRELSDEVFTSGSKSEFDRSYSRHFGPLRPLANRTADRLYYTRSDCDLHDSLWVYRQPGVIRIPIPCGRSGKAYCFRRPTTSMYVQVSPSGIETVSWLDDSSRIRPLSTFTMSTPSWERIRAPVGTPVRPPALVNASLGVRPRRAHSLPPFRSAGQGISSNTRRLHEI